MSATDLNSTLIGAARAELCSVLTRDQKTDFNVLQTIFAIFTCEDIDAMYAYLGVYEDGPHFPACQALYEYLVEKPKHAMHTPAQRNLLSQLTDGTVQHTVRSTRPPSAVMSGVGNVSPIILKLLSSDALADLQYVPGTLEHNQLLALSGSSLVNNSSPLEVNRPTLEDGKQASVVAFVNLFGEYAKKGGKTFFLDNISRKAQLQILSKLEVKGKDNPPWSEWPELELTKQIVTLFCGEAGHVNVTPVSLFKGIAMKVLPGRQAWHFQYDEFVAYNAEVINLRQMYPDVLQTMGVPALIKLYLTGTQPLHLAEMLRLRVSHYTSLGDVLAEANIVAALFKSAALVRTACSLAYPNMSKVVDNKSNDHTQ